MKQSLFVLLQLLLNTWTVTVSLAGGTPTSYTDCSTEEVASGSGGSEDEINTALLYPATTLTPCDIQSHPGHSDLDSVLASSTETSSSSILRSIITSQPSTSLLSSSSSSPVVSESFSSMESLLTRRTQNPPIVLPTSVVVATDGDLTSTLRFSPEQTMSSPAVSVPPSSLLSSFSNSVNAHTGLSGTVTVEAVPSNTLINPSLSTTSLFISTFLQTSVTSEHVPSSATADFQPITEIISLRETMTLPTNLPYSSPTTMTLTKTAVTETLPPSITASHAPLLSSSYMATPSPTQIAVGESLAHTVIQQQSVPTLPIESSPIIGSSPNASLDAGPGPDVDSAGSSTPLLYSAVGGSIGACFLIAVIVIAFVAIGALLLKRRRRQNYYIYEIGNASRRSSMVGDINASLYLPFSQIDGHLMGHLSTTSLSAASMTNITPRDEESKMFEKTLDNAYKSSTFQRSKRTAINKTGSSDLDVRGSSPVGDKHSQSLSLDSDSSEGCSHNRIVKNRGKSTDPESTDENQETESESVKRDRNAAVADPTESTESESERLNNDDQQNSPPVGDAVGKEPEENKDCLDEKKPGSASPDVKKKEKKTEDHPMSPTATGKLLTSEPKKETKNEDTDVPGKPKEVEETEGTVIVIPPAETSSVCDSKVEESAPSDNMASEHDTQVASNRKTHI